MFRASMCRHTACVTAAKKTHFSANANANATLTIHVNTNVNLHVKTWQQLLLWTVVKKPISLLFVFSHGAL